MDCSCKTLFVYLSCAAFAVAAASAPKRATFDIPAAPAIESFKLFAAQANTQLLYAVEVVDGVKTNAVKGDFAPREALDRMLAGTPLIAHETSNGAIAVRKENDVPNAERAARRTANARPQAADAASSRADIGAPAANEVQVLSPFEVVAENRGYYGANVMSGTRLNSKLEDLASSITVVTKQQMEDFALRDINDIFLYEASTEGTGNFTDFSVDRNGFVVDNTTGGQAGAVGSLGGVAGANRVRGIKQANIAVGNFATSGRVPIDSFTVDSVEISRGPNSTIFGLGNASGTVNIIPARAGLRTRKTNVELRTDSLESTRAAVSHNQPLIPGKLAVRGIAITQDNYFRQEPSVDHSTRYVGMVTYQPFKNTTLRASYERYANFARLPNSLMPRDGIGYWLENGKPTWDPITSTVHLNGTSTVVTQANDARLLPPGLSANSSIYTRSNLYVNGDGTTGLWSVGRLSNGASPGNLAGNVRLLQTSAYPRSGLDQTQRSITNRSIYDWTSVNLVAPNYSTLANSMITVELEQLFLNTPRHLLALQAGWNKEDSTLYRWDSLGQSSESPLIVAVDINERLLDGTVNPYFLRPYVGAAEPSNYYRPHRRNIYRGQLAYQFKLAREKNGWRWLGDHSFAGYYEYNHTYASIQRYRDAIISSHAWLPEGADRSNGLDAARIYSRYYLGDSTGSNVDYGVRNSFPSYGPMTYRWFNGATNQWVNETATVGPAYRTGTTGDRTDLNSRSQTLIKTLGVTWQGFLLGGRVIPTVGLRKDENYNRRGLNRLAADGFTLDLSSQNEWSGGAWELNSGRTTTKGIVVKPFRGLGRIEQAAGQGGVTGAVSQMLQSLNLHYNKSDSFLPEVVQQDLFANLLPNPTGKGKDYGFSFSAVGDKLVVRYNQYETLQLNSREGQNGTIASRTARVEVNYNGNNDPLNLYSLASRWVDTLQPGLTGDAREAAIVKYTGLPAGRARSFSNYTIGATSDVVAKGREIEVNYNPTAHWTIKLNAAQQKSIDSGISQELMQYLAARMPAWKALIDPLRGTPWYTTDYGGSRPTPEIFLTQQVFDPIKLAQANEGKSRSQIREWRINTLTNYRLAGITDHKWLRKVSLSGAVRWEDKASIGYYASAIDPASYDPNRPIYDKAHAYFDLGIGYVTRIFADKVRLRAQLNARNVFEDGRLQPIGAFPNGTAHTYRIIDPRLVVLTTSFEF